MTLLVRDEEDIVRGNLEHHFSQGVDFVIATDNGSCDGTRTILEEYQASGRLLLIDEPAQDYSQYRWVNRMGELASLRYGAQAVFHCDADEFWIARSGNLKDSILAAPVDVLSVNVKNVLLCDRGGRESYETDARWVVTNPLRTSDAALDSRSINLYLFPYPPKVMFKTDKGALSVTMGNHGVTDTHVTQGGTDDVVVLHYPVRSYECFVRKIVNGGAAYERNTEFDQGVGYQWRWWYQRYEEGAIDDEYRLLIVDESQVEELQTSGVIAPLREFLVKYGGLPLPAVPGLQEPQE
jgi:hypothetical protein